MIEKIDSYLLFVIAAFAIPYVVLLILKIHRKHRVWRILHNVWHVLTNLMLVSVFIYFIWRTFYAFY